MQIFEFRFLDDLCNDNRSSGLKNKSLTNSFFLSVASVHLYYLFPSLEEGGLATYRTAIVQNQHLAMLAKVNCWLGGPLRGLRADPDVKKSLPFFFHPLRFVIGVKRWLFWRMRLAGLGSGGPLEVFLKHSPVPVSAPPPLPNPSQCSPANSRSLACLQRAQQ